MADYVNTNTIQTRISLKYDSYANWTSKNPKLLKGELAIATVPADTKKPDGSTNLFENLPNVVMKVGDGTNNYNDLPFVSGLAADVYAWAKASTKPSYSISEIAGAQEYRIVPMAGEGNENKYALQSRKAGSENAWSNVADSVIDLSQIVADIADHESRIGTIESDLNTATTGLKARMDAVEDAIEGLTGNSGGIQGAINTTIQTLDANVSQEAGADGLALNIVEVDGVITSISGSIKAETYDAYGSAAAVKKELTEGAIKTNADAIDVIEGSDAGKSMREVATAVATSAVENLDKTVNQEAGTDGLALEVVQENGLLKSVSGSIKANTYDAYGAAAAVQGSTTHTVAEAYALADAAQTAEEVAAAVLVEENARKAAIQALDYTGYEAGSAEGATISFVGTISETDGVVSAAKRDLVFTDAYSASNPAATKKYVDDAVKTGVADLNGAMHFEGVYEEMPSVNHNGEAFVAGDVIIVGKTEYVYSNGAFVELGDEGAIAAALGALTLDEIGGEAKTLVISQSNGKVSAEAKDIKIEQSQVNGLGDALNSKLDAETYNAFKNGEYATLSGKVDTLNGDATVAGSVAKQIADSLGALDMDEKGAADKTLKIKQVDGAVTAEEVAIQIKQSQVTDLERQLSQRLQAQEFYDFKEDEFVPLQTAINNLDSTINTKIQALDGTASQTAGADGLALSVTTTDGVVTAISGSIAANTYDAYGAAAGVKKELTEGAIKDNADAIKTMQGSDTTLSMRQVAAAEAKSAVEALDVDDTAVAGEFVTAVAQENGAVKISRAAVNIKNLAQDTNSYVVFDCGTSEINI